MIGLSRLAAQPTVFAHPDFEALLEAVCSTWLRHPRSPIPEPVVVPSVAFSDHLQLGIADRLGVCMGIEFLTPQGFILRATRPRNLAAWEKTRLQWEILPLVAEHSPNLGVDSPTLRDRFALAGLLADQFDQYGHFRPEIIEAWTANRAFPSANVADTAEEWQRKLWHALRTRIGQPHPAEEFRSRRNDLEFQRTLASAFPRLLVLGSGVIDPLLASVLQTLAAAGSAVEVHVILPSLQFLGDLRIRRPTPDQSPEETSYAAAHPLLESMARQAVGTFHLLGRLDDQYTNWPDLEPDTIIGLPKHLLGRIQSDIRTLRAPTRHDAPDPSLRVHSCFGPRREIETLHDEILRAFEEIPNLRPDDIHIVTPSLETYAPLVSAVLEQGSHPLPVRLMELPGFGRPAALEGLLALLDLARSGRYEASGLMDLVQLPAVQNALGITDDGEALDRIRGWIRNSGVVRGIGADQPGTWPFSRDRLIAGRWFGPDSRHRYPDSTFILPVASRLGDESDLEARFLRWFRDLEITFLAWRNLASARDWADRLDHAVQFLLGADEEGILAMHPLTAQLRELSIEEPLDSATIFDWLDAGTRENPRRALVSGRIAFGRFRQLQNLPCRVLAMVGMEDGAFPGRHRPPSWDLLSKAPRVWDRNARVDDRQLFLDALLTPTDRLIITAATRNVRTKKSEPFSSCVDELIRAAGHMGVPRESLVIEHRLQPFSPDYFRTRDERSFSEDFARVATSLNRSGERISAPLWTADSTGSTSPSEITLDALTKFWRSPAAGFLHAQGIRLPNDAEDDRQLDRVEIPVNSLTAWKIADGIVRSVFEETAPLEFQRAEFRASRALPAGHLGDSVWHSQLEVSEPLGRALRTLSGTSEDVSIDLETGFRLRGTLQFDATGQRLIAWRPKPITKVRHFLGPWLEALFSAAAGRSLPTLLLDPNSHDGTNERPPIAPDAARRQLEELLAGFQTGCARPLCFAPVTSDKLAGWFASGQADAIDRARDEWMKSDPGGGGEGIDAAAQWAWRDRDPFEDVAQWRHWAETVSEPLREWGGFK